MNDQAIEMNDQAIEAGEDLPTTEDNFNSLAITIDHLVREGQDDGETPLKVVFSNFEPTDALLKQVDYFISRTGETRVNPLASKANVLALGVAHEQPGPVYIYTPSARLTNIITSMDTFLEFVESEGNFKAACSALIALAMGMQVEYTRKGLDQTLMVTWQGKQ